jgi:hypothetical protein
MLLAGWILRRIMLPTDFMSKVVLPSLPDYQQQVTEDDYNDDTNEKKIFLKKTNCLRILYGHNDNDMHSNGSTPDKYTDFSVQSCHLNKNSHEVLESTQPLFLDGSLTSNGITRISCGAR